MPDNANRSDVEVDFKDIYGTTITDNVEIKIYNTQLQSLKDIYNVPFKGKPEILSQVPAFPTGHAQMIVTPTKYRFKQRFINVQAGETNKITEFFFVEPSKANPRPIEFADLAAKTYGVELLRILKASGIGAAAWNKLNKRNRATVLNLCAKMSKETVKSGTKLITFAETIDQTWLDTKHWERIYAGVKKELLPALRNYPQAYFSVSGGMHHFPPDGWVSVKPPDSFKTLRDSAGNIQLTFAEKGGEAYLADIDLDDHTGLEHVADVLKHKFSGKDTDPYDIQQILWFSQQLDAEYRLL
jgi:hypothetical protein